MLKFFNKKISIQKNKKEENIYDFLSGKSCDKYGRNIKEIWGYDKNLLEKSHNYIQRLFPTTEKSIFEDSPVIDPVIDKKYINNPLIKENIKKSFKIMLSFYGFNYDGETIVDKNEEKHWITKNNHNYLRITRILTSLKIFGLEKEANEFYSALITLSKKKEIDEKSLKYWKEAIK